MWRQKLKRKSLLSLLGVFLAATFIAASPVYAQQSSSNGFLVSPVREELVVDQGKSETVELTVENATNAAMTAKAIVNDFEPSTDESGQPRILLDENASVSGNSFKTIVSPISNFTLGPRERKTVPVRITVPANASSGGYYGAIRFINDAGGQDNNVALAASVGTIFLVTVPGDVKESLELVEFTAAKDGSTGRFFVGTGQISLITRLRNTGNVHVKPFGRVQVADRSGKVIEDYEFNLTEPRANVLPNSTRKFEDKLTKSYGFGKYTATANLGYGDGGNLITAKTTFWVVPAWVFIVLGIALVGLAVGGFLIYRRFSGPSKHKAKSRR